MRIPGIGLGEVAVQIGNLFLTRLLAQLLHVQVDSQTQLPRDQASQVRVMILLRGGQKGLDRGPVVAFLPVGATCIDPRLRIAEEHREIRIQQCRSGVIAAALDQVRGVREQRVAIAFADRGSIVQKDLRILFDGAFVITRAQQIAKLHHAAFCQRRCAQ